MTVLVMMMGTLMMVPLMMSSITVVFQAAFILCCLSRIVVPHLRGTVRLILASRTLAQAYESL